MFTLYENLLPNDIFQNLYSNLRNRTNWAFTNASLSKEDQDEVQKMIQELMDMKQTKF